MTKRELTAALLEGAGLTSGVVAGFNLAVWAGYAALGAALVLAGVVVERGR